MKEITGKGTMKLEMVFNSVPSSGQLTTIETLIILENVTSKTLILDDVFETLDENNQQILMEIIVGNMNIELLTHNISVVNMIENFAKFEDKQIKIENIDSSFQGVIVTWPQLLNDFRSINPGDAEIKRVLRSIIKILARYYAKFGSIHSVIGEADKKTIESQNNYAHFIFSAKIFHYLGAIPTEEVLSFFPWMISTSKNMNSIEAIEKITEKLSQLSQNIFAIKISKLINFLDSIKCELSYEKILYDAAPDGNQKFWGDPLLAYKKYKHSRKNDIIPSLPDRNNRLIHILDVNPHFVLGE